MKKRLYVLLSIILFLIIFGIVVYINIDDAVGRNMINGKFENDGSLEDGVDIEDTKLLFSIKSLRLNCYTKTLYVYVNNTYVYGDINGSYDYDVNKIIESIDKYEVNEHGPFVLKYNNNDLYLYDNNNILQEFLNSININLDECATDYE